MGFCGGTRVTSAVSNRRMRKTACPVVWKGHGVKPRVPIRSLKNVTETILSRSVPDRIVGATLPSRLNTSYLRRNIERFSFEITRLTRLKHCSSLFTTSLCIDKVCEAQRSGDIPVPDTTGVGKPPLLCNSTKFATTYFAASD